jgi:hypothetical protein
MSERAAALLRRLLPLAASEGVSPLLGQPSAQPWLPPDGWGEPWPVTARPPWPARRPRVLRLVPGQPHHETPMAADPAC